MIKVIFLCRARPGMTRDEMHTYHRDIHTPIGLKVGGIMGWHANYVLDASTQALGQPEPAFDLIVSTWWDDLEAMQQAFATAEGQAASIDNANFVDMETLRILVVDERAIIPLSA